MDQIPLLYDDEFHALRAMIEGGKGYKATAMDLWPSMRPESAYARLKSCVNPDRDEKLGFGEIVRACRFNNRFDPLYYLCAETGHDTPRRIVHQDAIDALARQIAANMADSQRLMARLEQMTQVPR